MKQRLARLSLGKRLAVVVALALALAGVVVAVAGASSKPPTPSLHSSENNPTTSTSISFTFSDSQAGVTFKCSKDGSAFTTCHSAQPYSGLAQGNHTFSVQAVSGNGTSGNASFAWAIVPPTPVIGTPVPANPTGATSATFKFTDTLGGVGFKCSLDGSSFSTCTSPKPYSGLGGGNHTFQVLAQIGSNPPSAPASYTWLIDKTAPAITITFPVNGHAYNTAGWGNGCVPLGVCGTATDPGGVQSVAVAIQQQSTGKYWNGSAFSSNSIVFLNASGTSAWKYAIGAPAAGKYILSVKATDNFGNTTASNSYKTSTFTIDNTAPPAPVLIEKPSNPSNDKSPEFEFTNTDPSVSFTCKLDSGSTASCTGDTDHDGDNNSQGDHGHGDNSKAFGEWEFHNLSAGPHCFYVFATDPAGNVGPPTSYCWTISGTATATTIMAFSGTPQDTTLNTPFGAPLVALVTGAGNVPVPGVTVTFTAPSSSGPSGTFAGGVNTAVTGADGKATSAVFTANGHAGSYSVTATAPGVVTPASFSLTNDTSFTISGDIPDASTQGFYPGLTQPFNLTIKNPYNFQITLTSLTITVASTTDHSGCSGSLLTVTTPFNPSPAVHIGAGVTETLTSAGATTAQLPQLTLDHSAPDACQGAKFTLTYGGSAGTP